ncbi:RloB domain-containing protein [Hwanghaeella sp.]|uniref:RloB domain-containing protein n=1 Tax=Hwanghaeella sp. TaxID=2605943 RepID=UPI003CCBC577
MKIKRKPTHFVGCEGQSEVGFVAWFHQHMNNTGRDVALSRSRCTEGDGFEVVRKAISEMNRLQKASGKFRSCWVMVDDDKWEGKKAAALQLARREGIEPIIANDNFEAFLGRLVACDLSIGAERARQFLVNAWPNYQKGLDKTSLAEKTELLVQGLELYRNRNCSFTSFLKKVGYF